MFRYMWLFAFILIAALNPVLGALAFLAWLFWRVLLWRAKRRAYADRKATWGY